MIQSIITPKNQTLRVYTRSERTEQKSMFPTQFSNPLLNSNQYEYARRWINCVLEEDIGLGDLSAQLINESTQSTAFIITREPAILCGKPWVELLLSEFNPLVDIHWLADEGSTLIANQKFIQLEGSSRALLTIERSILNILQTLMATATGSAQWAEKIAHTKTIILDTRKTLPGLRIAQKYAIQVGGCKNHRIGLYDAFLIKENHIIACGSITQAIANARQLSSHMIEVEVENLIQLEEAFAANPDRIMLDNFSKADIAKAIQLNAKKIPLEVSGIPDEAAVLEIAELGIDFISLGSLTKHVRAIDLSMRFIPAS